MHIRRSEPRIVEVHRCIDLRDAERSESPFPFCTVEERQTRRVTRTHPAPTPSKGALLPAHSRGAGMPAVLSAEEQGDLNMPQTSPVRVRVALNGTVVGASLVVLGVIAPAVVAAPPSSYGVSGVDTSHYNHETGEGKEEDTAIDWNRAGPADRSRRRNDREMTSAGHPTRGGRHRHPDSTAPSRRRHRTPYALPHAQPVRASERPAARPLSASPRPGSAVPPRAAAPGARRPSRRPW